MDREVAVSGWAEQWVTRTFEPLVLETNVASCAITAAALIVSVKLLCDLRRTRRMLEQNPTDRAAILAVGDKRTKKSLKVQHRLSWALLLHSQVLWLVDAGIGIWAIYSDASNDPASYTTQLWINMAIYCLGLFVLFMSVLVLFPLFQFFLVGKMMKSFQPSATSFADFIPGARILTNQLAYLWLFAGFMVVSWWSILDSSLLRIVILEAVFGSGLAWLHASTLLQSSTEELMQLDIEALNLKDGVKLYSKQVRSVYIAPKKDDILPKYETVPGSEQAADEKVRLL